MSKYTTTCLVQIPHFSDMEMSAHLVLDEKPTRQEQKLKTLTKYVKQYPSGWKKRLELAELLYVMGYWEQAVEEYYQVKEQQPQLLELVLKLGKILQLMGRESEAIEVYENTLSLVRNQATQHHLGGLIEVCRGNIQEAIKAFEAAASLEPSNKAHWLALGQIQMERENSVAALGGFDEILSLNQDEIMGLLGSYDVLLTVGRFPEAGKRLSRMQELAPKDFRVLKRLVEHRCRMRLVLGEEGKQTKKMISSFLRLAPDLVDAHDLLANYHLFRGEWGKGVEVLAEFTQEHPHNPSGWYYYAQCLFHAGENQEAVEAMLKAYRLYPHDCEIYRALCEILVNLPPTPLAPSLVRGVGGDLTRVEEANNTTTISLASIVEKMLERFPERWSVWATAGRILVENFQEIEQGCSFSAKGTQLQPQLPDAWFLYGRVLALAGKHQEAVEALEQGWQLLPATSVSAAVWLGETYQVLGNKRASQRWWQEACQLAQELMEFNPATAYYWQGRAFDGLGNSLGAIEAYRSALTQQLLYPARREVKEALKRLRLRRRKGYRS